MSDEWDLAAGVRRLAARWGTGETERAQKALVAYGLELARWNRRINLIRFRSWQALCERHLVDGLAASRQIGSGTRSLIDVGSGAGIPGAVIAILRPELEVVALEPTHKKHAFLRAIRRNIPLRNFTPHAARLGGRDEPKGLRGRFDVAISRATWAVPEWLDRGSQLVRPEGLILAMEGRDRSDLPPGAERHFYAADGRERAIISLPAAATPATREDA